MFFLCNDLFENTKTRSIISYFNKNERWYLLGLVRQLCNASYSGGLRLQILLCPHSEFKTILGKLVRSFLKIKSAKGSGIECLAHMCKDTASVPRMENNRGKEWISCYHNVRDTRLKHGNLSTLEVIMSWADRSRRVHSCENSSLSIIGTKGGRKQQKVTVTKRSRERH